MNHPRKTTRRSSGRLAPPPRGPKQSSIRRVVQGLRRVVKALHTYSKDVYASYGLTGPQLWALSTLRTDGPMPIGRLAEALAVHPSSASVLVDRLERRGLVRRRTDAGDRRRVELELTARGRALVAASPEAAQGRLLHGLQAMSAHDVDAICRTVERLVEVMEVADLKARFFFSDE